MMLNAQARPFYYPPHAAFYFHSSLPPEEPPPPTLPIQLMPARIQHPSHPLFHSYFLYPPPLAPQVSIVPPGPNSRFISLYAPLPPTEVAADSSSCSNNSGGAEADSTARTAGIGLGGSPGGDGPRRRPGGTLVEQHQVVPGQWSAANGPCSEKVVVDDKAKAVGDGVGGASFLWRRSPCKQLKGLVWLPKGEITKGRFRSLTISSFRSAFSSSSAESYPSLEFDESHPEQGSRSTVMIKNIPNKYSREMLLELLDEHCQKENEKMQLHSPLPEAHLSQYDFVYIPMDFRNKCNLGYAFVNFTTPTAAWRLYKSLNNQKWTVFDSKKICHVCYARIQGKRALLDHFRYSYFRCDADEFLPAVFSPSRGGDTSYPPPTLVGKRCPPPITPTT